MTHQKGSLPATAGSLALHEHLATALEPPADVADAFEYARAELQTVLDDKLKASKLEGLVGPIRQGIARLKEQRAASGAELASKFNSEGEAAFELSYAALDTYYRGLDGIIGAATLHGDPPTIYGQVNPDVGHGGG